jgi:hypothetical protein
MPGKIEEIPAGNDVAWPIRSIALYDHSLHVADRTHLGTPPNHSKQFTWHVNSVSSRISETNPTWLGAKLDEWVVSHVSQKRFRQVVAIFRMLIGLKLLLLP